MGGTHLREEDCGGTRRKNSLKEGATRVLSKRGLKADRET